MDSNNSTMDSDASSIDSKFGISSNSDYDDSSYNYEDLFYPIGYEPPSESMPSSERAPAVKVVQTLKYTLVEAQLRILSCCQDLGISTINEIKYPHVQKAYEMKFGTPLNKAEMNDLFSQSKSTTALKKGVGDFMEIIEASQNADQCIKLRLKEDSEAYIKHIEEKYDGEALPKLTSDQVDEIFNPPEDDYYPTRKQFVPGYRVINPRHRQVVEVPPPMPDVVIPSPELPIQLPVPSDSQTDSVLREVHHPQNENIVVHHDIQIPDSTQISVSYDSQPHHSTPLKDEDKIVSRDRGFPHPRTYPVPFASSQIASGQRVPPIPRPRTRRLPIPSASPQLDSIPSVVQKQVEIALPLIDSSELQISSNFQHVSLPETTRLDGQNEVSVSNLKTSLPFGSSQITSGQRVPPIPPPRTRRFPILCDSQPHHSTPLKDEDKIVSRDRGFPHPRTYPVPFGSSQITSGQRVPPIPPPRTRRLPIPSDSPQLDSIPSVVQKQVENETAPPLPGSSKPQISCDFQHVSLPETTRLKDQNEVALFNLENSESSSNVLDTNDSPLASNVLHGDVHKIDTKEEEEDAPQAKRSYFQSIQLELKANMEEGKNELREAKNEFKQKINDEFKQQFDRILEHYRQKLHKFVKHNFKRNKWVIRRFYELNN